MSIKIGDFDVANQLLDNEFRIGVLEKLLENVLNNNSGLKLPTPGDLDLFRQRTAEELKKKYPNSGIEYKKILGMADIQLSTHGGLVETTIRQKQEVYYLVTSDNLSSIKSKSLLSDLFIFLSSLGWGAYFSVSTTLKSIHKPKTGSAPFNEIYLPLATLEDVFLIANILFTILTIIIGYISYSSLMEIKRGGNVQLGKAVETSQT